MQTKSYINFNNDAPHNRLSLKNTITLVCVFLLICVDSAFYFVNTQTGTVRMIIDLFAIFLLIITSEKVTIRRNSIYMVSLIFLISLVSGAITLSIKNTIIIIVAIVIGWLFTCIVSYSDFKNLYIRIMLFLAIFSLITFTIGVFAPQIAQLLPRIIREGSKINYRNAFFSVICIRNDISRNFGIFWEPGAFSIFLNIALYIELFEKKTSIKSITIMCLTILTTLSTLGFSCMLLLLMCYLIQTRVAVHNVVKKFILFFMFCFILYLVIDGEKFIYYVFDKLNTSEGKFTITTSVRIDAFIYMCKAFLSSPLWGVGYEEFLNIQSTYCSGMATFTFVNLLAMYGLIGGVLPIIGCFKFFWKNIKGTIPKLVMLGFTAIIFSTENYVQITFLYILIFYGFFAKEVTHEYSSDRN